MTSARSNTSVSSRVSISDEELSVAYSRVISTAKSNGYSTAIDEAFDALDIEKTGKLNRHDIQALMQAAAQHTKLDKQDLKNSVIEAAVDALICDAIYGGSGRRSTHDIFSASGGGSVGGEKDDGEELLITRSQFHDIFTRHPDMLSVFMDEETSLSRQESARSHMSREYEDDMTIEEKMEEDEQIWVHEVRTHWNNKWVALLWILLYIAANVAAFTVKAVKYANNEEAQAVFGNCIVVARGCAACLNLNACLVLLAMCKHFLTLTRKTRLRFVFPFDAIQEAHIMIGIVFALFAASHTAAHICDFHRFAYADEDDIYALFGDKLDPPEDPAGRWAYMLGTRAGITGIIMVFCLVVAYSFAFNRRKKFNRFWYTHHLLLLMLICLCIHGTDSLLEPYQSLYWVIGPLALYAVPRIWRETPLSSLDVVRMEVKKGDVVQLRLKKPKYYNGYVKAGMYGVLNVPQISRTEWHPFTLSSAPSDEYIEFHFRRVGRWTGRVHDLLESKADDGESSGIKDAPTVKVEGPIGASSQGFSDYSIIVLVGAGIGVTPMISVVKQLLASPGKVTRCFFYWTVRDRDSFLWFTDLMDEIFEADQKNVLQIRHFLTSVKHDDRDLGAVLLHHATRAHHKRTNVDLLLGQQIHHQVEVGRPDWLEELQSVRDETESLGEEKCGIFLCGPTKMAEAVYEASVTVSKQSTGFHMFFSKETF